MRLIVVLVSIFSALPVEAAELVRFSGPPHVLEGDVLDVGTRRVRLYGIDAPEIKQTCQGPKRLHPCGKIAATGLMDVTAGATEITCKAFGTSAEGLTIAQCLDPQGFDLSRQMLYTGWALATPKASAAFHQLEQASRAAGRGLWRWRVTAPWLWRSVQK